MTKLIFAAIILFVGFITSHSLKAKEKKSLASLVLTIAILLSIGSVTLACFQTVPTGHTGVVTTFGRVENTTLDSGVHFVLPWQQVVKMDNRVQKQTVELPCFSSDIQEVNLTYTINFQIKKSDAQNIYRTIGVDYYNTVIQPCITESVKVVTARYTAEQLVGKRNELAAAIEVDLTEKLLNYNIELVSTSIENMQVLERPGDIPFGMVGLPDKVRNGAHFGEGDAVAQAGFEEGGAFHGLHVGRNCPVAFVQLLEGIAGG